MVANGSHSLLPASSEDWRALHAPRNLHTMQHKVAPAELGGEILSPFDTVGVAITIPVPA